MKPTEPLHDADALASLLDELMENGTQHINLTVGEQMRIQTVNSTDCSPQGACAVPNFDCNDDDPEVDPLPDEA